MRAFWPDPTMEDDDVGHRDRVKALLSYTVEHRLLGTPRPTLRVRMSSPWDVWWVCYRAGSSAEDLGLDPRRTAGTCDSCVRDVLALTAATPPLHPGHEPSSPCGCLNQWAISMRVPVPDVPWPALHLSLAMIKPGTDAETVITQLARSYDVALRGERTLTDADVRRLYPDAYGAEYIGRQDAYLTSAPVTIVVLRTAAPANSGVALKRRIRRHLGVCDLLRNHLHMPDNPGDALCDLAHLAGADLTTDLYERYDRADAAFRLDRYRALLGQRPTGPVAD